MTSDEAELRRLNEQYIAAYMAGDVDWYAAHLLDDFTCRRADGSVVDRAEFLRRTAEGPDVSEYRLEKVEVRISADKAEVDGLGTITKPDGSQGTSRYTDVYRRVRGSGRLSRHTLSGR